MTEALEEIHLKGFPISPGVAIAPLFFSRSNDADIVERSIEADEIKSELKRYRGAINQARHNFEVLKSQSKNAQNEEASIVDAYLQLLQDPMIVEEIENEICRLKKNAEFVLHQTIRSYRKKFNAISNPFFRERFYDLQAIARYISDCLRGNARTTYLGAENSIIYTQELSIVDFTEIDFNRVRAFVTEVNGVTSHAAIAVKAKGIPFVTSIEFAALETVLESESMAIVDGFTGDLYVNPSEERLQHYLAKTTQVESQKLSKPTSKRQQTHVKTRDGYPVRLSANIETLMEAKATYSQGLRSVGLYRTEYAFLMNEDLPNEEEQYENYKSIVESMHNCPVAIRAFDLGGDKYFHGQKVALENNPFLGCRGIRVLLREKEFFKTQLRAMIRASVHGHLSLVLPMISSLCEVLEAKELLRSAHREVEKKYKLKIPALRVGCMIEVPSAAIIADLLAKECDFFSIGTNDLVQYTIAVDRSNYALNELYTPVHPSILRLIKMVVFEANKRGIPVSICSEMAADPKFTALLLGLGVHEFSVPLRQVDSIKKRVNAISLAQAKRLTDEALSLNSSSEIAELLDIGS